MIFLRRFLFAGSIVFAGFILVSCGGGGGGGGAGGGGTPAASTLTFNATLTLAQEAPTPITPAGATPGGSGSVVLNLTAKTLTGSFTTTNVVNAVAAHIHDGDIGVPGGIVIGLEQSPSGSGIWVVPATARALTDAEIARLRAGGYYVNVHTQLNGTGEIRGQLLPPGNTAFNATLTLAQEEPTPITPAGATPSGSGSITLDPAAKTLTGSFTTTNVVNAVAAHIHDGDIGVAGGIVIGLEQSPAGSGTWVVPATARALTDAEIARLRAGGYYVNVHTQLNGSGEIRGQLIPPG